MAQTFMVFDFGTKEEAAQQAKHKLDTWRQAFHLSKKLEYKFARQTADNEESAKEPPKTEKSKASTKPAKKEAEETEASGDIRVIVRLSFSDHEKLSSQRWIERIPGEEPFKDASPKLVRHGESNFNETEQLFDQLD